MSYALAVTNPAPKQRVVNQVVPPQTQSPPKTTNQPPKKEIPQQTITSPNTAGISPAIVFELKIPVTQKKEQEGLEDSADLTESFEENDEEVNNETENNKQNRPQKFNTFVVDGLEQRQARINDLVSYLLNNCDDKNFEMRGGFRISKRYTTKEGNVKKSGLPQFDLETIPQALGYVKSIVDLLRNSQSVNVPIDDQDELLFVRAGNQVRVTRNKGSNNKELWFQLEDLALEIRDQGKKYLKVAQAVEDTLERKESRADKSKKEQMKKRRIAVSDKLQTRTFRSLLKTMKDLFLSSDLPALKEKYQKQEQIKDQQRKRLIEQNRDMMSMALNAAPVGFMEMDISHIGRIEEPQESVEETPVVQQNVASETSQDTPPVVKEKRKKRTKAEIRRAQEENFDNIELIQGNIVEKHEENKTSYDDVETVQTQGSAYQNSYDLGEISQENIFEITQPETRTNTVEIKKNKKPQKKAGKSPTTTDTSVSKPQSTQQQKKKNKSKNEKPKKQTQSQIQKEEKQSINTPVLLLVGATTVVACYYAYTLLQ